MNNEAKLGTIPSGEEGRDAVHVAILPVRAREALIGGTPVKMDAENQAVSCKVEDAIGVVDPFIKQGQLGAGSWFWLCLYPKTITGLRHVWEHPSFPLAQAAAPISEKPPGEKQASEAWLKEYVKRHCPYWEGEPDSGYSKFLGYVKRERWIYYYGTDCHGLYDVDDADELFRHLGVVLGQRIDASYFEAFTCSC